MKSQSPGGDPGRHDAEPLSDQSNGTPVWLQRLANRRAMTVLALASLALLALAVLGAWYLFSMRSPSSTTQPKITLTPPASLIDLATEYPELGSVLQDPKLDSAYKEFLLVYQQDGPDAAYELARKRGLISAEDELRLTLELDTTDSSALQQQLQSQGIKITAASGNLIDVAIPLDILIPIMASGDPSGLLGSITDLQHVIRVRVPSTISRDSGHLSLPSPVASSGVFYRHGVLYRHGIPYRRPSSTSLESLSMIAADAWQAAGYSGQGVKVGILDGGFDGYKDLLGSDLPPDVIAQSFISGLEVDQMGNVHGTACAEIVHDIAPGAELYLVTAETVAEFRQAVDWMVDQGINIITHSGGWLYGPKDGKSAPSAVVEKAVSNGVLWVNSSGNYAVSHYRGPFTDDDGDGFHEFSPGDEMMEFEPEGQVQMVLNWDDWEVGDQDFDLFVVDADGNEIVSSENTQSGPGDSVEMIIYEFTDSGPYYIVFYGAQVTRPATIDFYIPDTDIEHYTIEYSLNTPGDAPWALTVGAVNWQDDSLEYYSSQGPTDDGRFKPEISAPARVSTSSYSRPFYGTSASTPHVAGAAALVWEAHPNFGAQEVVDYLTDNSLDYGPSGPDYGFGFGRLWLGEPPDFSLEPTPTQAQVAPLPSPTTVAVIVPTVPQPPSPVPTSAATPERRPTSTPIAEPGDSGDTGLLLLLMACVILPGLLGMGGIGLLGGVWYWNRSRKAARRQVGPPRARPPARPPVVSPQSKDICPRCGTPHRMDASFCPKCGLSLRWGVPDAKPAAEPDAKHRPSPPTPNCENCGRLLRSPGKFCPYCGHPR